MHSFVLLDNGDSYTVEADQPWTLDAMQQVVGGEHGKVLVQSVPLSPDGLPELVERLGGDGDDLVMLVDEEAVMCRRGKLNRKASLVLGQRVIGNAIITRRCRI